MTPEQYHSYSKFELEMRTGTYASFGRGFQIFYMDLEKTQTIVQFNLIKLSELQELNKTFLDFQVKIINYMKNNIIFKIPE